MDYTKIPSKDIINKTVQALKENGMEVFIVGDREKAKRKILDLIPRGAEIMNMTSVTLESLGIVKELENSYYELVKEKLAIMDRETQGREMQKLGAAPEWAIGSVHAITQDGKIMIASNTGSQIPAFVYGADRVIFVVCMQKIVKDLDQGFNRIYEHSLVLESERARKAYGVSGSNVSKILIVNREIKPNRIHIILIPEVL